MRASSPNQLAMGDISAPLRFEGFTLDLANRQLLRDGLEVELGTRYFDALVLLAQSPGALVSKDRFMDQVWKGIPVTDEALTQCIRTLRRALGDKAANPRFIETVPKHGYRFVAGVEQISPPAIPTMPQSPAGRLAGASTLGALGAGLSGGLFYGVIGTIGGAAGVATLVLLAAALAVLGGAGIGAGMALASLVRGEGDWGVILGGAVGGIVAGALGSALAAHGMQSLTGIDPGRVTGMFEGLALGAAAAASLVLAMRGGLGRTQACLLAALLGGLMTGITALAGGRFLGTTLSLIEDSFPASHLAMGQIGSLFGESGFHAMSGLGTAILEGAVFSSAIVAANLGWQERGQ